MKKKINNKVIVSSLAVLGFLCSYNTLEAQCGQGNTYQYQGGYRYDQNPNERRYEYRRYDDMSGDRRYGDNRGVRSDDMNRDRRYSDNRAVRRDDMSFDRRFDDNRGYRDANYDQSAPYFDEMRDPFNKESIASHKVTVVRVLRRGTAEEGRANLQLIVRNNGAQYFVDVAPSDYLDQQGVELRDGDQIEVRGSKITTPEGQSVIIATELTIRGKTFKLRDNDGKTLWENVRETRVERREERRDDGRGFFEEKMWTEDKDKMKDADKSRNY